MAKAGFILLRVLTAISALLGLAGMILVILVTAAIELLKGGAHAIAAVVTLIASGFREERSWPAPDPLADAPLAGLAIVFLAMFISVFMPRQKVYLHIVAGATVVFGVWRLWTVSANPESPVFFLPMIGVWFLYYALCLRWAGVRKDYSATASSAPQ